MVYCARSLIYSTTYYISCIEFLTHVLRTHVNCMHGSICTTLSNYDYACFFVNIFITICLKENYAILNVKSGEKRKQITNIKFV